MGATSEVAKETANQTHIIDLTQYYATKLNRRENAQYEQKKLSHGSKN